MSLYEIAKEKRNALRTWATNFQPCPQVGDDCFEDVRTNAIPPDCLALVMLDPNRVVPENHRDEKKQGVLPINRLRGILGQDGLDLLSRPMRKMRPLP